MNILITYNDAESSLKRNLVLWKLITRRTYQHILVLFLVGLVAFVYGLFQPYSFSTGLGGGTSYYDFHFSIAFGIGFGLLALIYFYHIQVTKKKFLNAAKAHIERAKRVGNIQLSFHLTPQSIKYSNFEEVREIKWSAFSFYRAYKGFIVFYQDESQPSYLIEVAKLSPEEQKELLDFLQKNVYQRATINGG